MSFDLPEGLPEGPYSVFAEKDYGWYVEDEGGRALGAAERDFVAPHRAAAEFVASMDLKAAEAVASVVGCRRDAPLPEHTALVALHMAAEARAAVLQRAAWDASPVPAERVPTAPGYGHMTVMRSWKKGVGFRP